MISLIEKWPELTPEHQFFIWLRFRGILLKKSIRSMRKYQGASWLIMMLTSIGLIFCDDLSAKLTSMTLIIYSGSMLIYNSSK